MGLDLVEIVLKTEDAFGIAVNNENAAQIRTPRELADYIATKVALTDAPSCLSQQAFYFLRKRFDQQLTFSRGSFRPHTPLEELVPKQNRKVIWAKLQTEVGARALPDLMRPTWLVIWLAASTVFVFCYATVTVWHYFGSFTFSWLLGLTAAVAFGRIAAVASRPTKQYFQPSYKTVGDTTKFLIANKPHLFKQNQQTWTRAQILIVVRQIVAEWVGDEAFSDDADFVRDLHLD